MSNDALARLEALERQHRSVDIDLIAKRYGLDPAELEAEALEFAEFQENFGTGAELYQALADKYGINAEALRQEVRDVLEDFGLSAD
jgi:antitoxin component HigA of HigAB toxin-antitoxin module